MKLSHALVITAVAGGLAAGSLQAGAGGAPRASSYSGANTRLVIKRAANFGNQSNINLYIDGNRVAVRLRGRYKGIVAGPALRHDEADATFERCLSLFATMDPTGTRPDVGLHRDLEGWRHEDRARGVVGIDQCGRVYFSHYEKRWRPPEFPLRETATAEEAPSDTWGLTLGLSSNSPLCLVERREWISGGLDSALREELFLSGRTQMQSNRAAAAEPLVKECGALAGMLTV